MMRFIFPDFTSSSSTFFVILIFLVLSSGSIVSTIYWVRAIVMCTCWKYTQPINFMSYLQRLGVMASTPRWEMQHHLDNCENHKHCLIRFYYFFFFFILLHFFCFLRNVHIFFFYIFWDGKPESTFLSRKKNLTKREQRILFFLHL